MASLGLVISGLQVTIRYPLLSQFMSRSTITLQPERFLFHVKHVHTIQLQKLKAFK